ncbi:acyl-CoA dehydrogenase family protein [Kitasatospora sp. NPDC006697]|uniref:acyl-CoA dehydrogenase family protein n=1 Tax=Kitasatospora sp. NPDC006697 TaxID=3364020 RepID=UPI00369C46D1
MTATPAATPAAGPEAELDALLGDWAATAARAADDDEGERFPAELCARLDEFGLHRYYVPEPLGGRFDDHEVMLRLWRTVARRDLAATVAHGKTYLGVAPVWLAASPEQAAEVAAVVLSGAPVGCALSEPEHGADLVNGSARATAQPGGYRLDGVKWPINNGSRATHLSVLARTAEASTARSHSIFLVAKESLESGGWRQLPKIRTHGIRGIDLAGVEFTGATVPADALLGEEGAGIETALRALQLTRTVCSAMSLGAGEQAVRLAARYAADRPGGPDRASRAVLARSAARLAAAEAAALVGVRSAHSLTGEMSVVSAVVKSVAPALVSELIRELAELLDVRSALVDGHEHGAFQRLARDHDVVAVFDGSTPVNRASLIQQFPRLARNLAAGRFEAEGLAEAVALGERPRPLDRGALSLLSRHGCSLVQSLPALADALAAAPGVPADLAGLASALRTAALRLAALMAEVRPAARPPMAAYELAAAYELCYAGTACLRLWSTQAQRHAGEPLWQDGLWARAALRVLLADLADLVGTPRPPADEQAATLLADHLLATAHSAATATPFGTPLPCSPARSS